MPFFLDKAYGVNRGKQNKGLHTNCFNGFRGCFDFIVGSEKGIYQVLASLLLSNIAALWREKETKSGSEEILFAAHYINSKQPLRYLIPILESG